MKYALITDTHFGARNDSTVIKKSQELFYEKVFFPTLEDRNVTKIIHLGDVFDRRKYINFNTLYDFKKSFFDRVSHFDVYIIMGNHDVYFKNTNEINSVELLLRDYDNFTIIKDQPLEIDAGILVPWINSENQDKIFNTMKSTSAKVCFGHFEISGYEVMVGMPHQGGLSLDLFYNFDQVYSGHFHVPSSRNNIRYLGAPYPMNWGDMDSRSRGFHLYDSETRSLEFIKNPYSAFKRFQYDDTDMAVEDISNYDFSEYENSYVRVIVKNKTNPYMFDLITEKLQNSGISNLKVLDETLLFKDDSDLKIEGIEQTYDIMVEYVNKLSTNIDKDDINEYMKTLYMKALSYDNTQESEV